jgi:hypothetical protein
MEWIFCPALVARDGFGAHTLPMDLDFNSATSAFRPKVQVLLNCFHHAGFQRRENHGTQLPAAFNTPFPSELARYWLRVSGWVASTYKDRILPHFGTTA